MSGRTFPRPATVWPWRVFAVAVFLAAAFLWHRLSSPPDPSPLPAPPPPAGDPIGVDNGMAPPPPSFNPAAVLTYVVAEGESIVSIARVFDITPESLAAANGLSPDDVISPGQTILIPPP